MIPLLLITGFLGSGKTTLLRRIAHRNAGRRLVFLVNEFSRTDIDGALLAETGADTISVAGGSIFCRCKVSDFIGSLREIPNRFGADGHPVGGVVVEASGIADPGVAAIMLKETQLDTQYRLQPIVSVVDPKSFHKLLATLPNIGAQIRAASLVLINKVDLCTESEISMARDRIAELNPHAEIRSCSHCEIELVLSRPMRPFDVHGEYAPCADPAFGNFRIDTGTAFDFPSFLNAVEPHLGEIFRIKGYAFLEGVPHLVDYSKAGWCQTAVSAIPDNPAIVVIVKGASLGKLRHLLAPFIDDNNQEQ